MTPPRHFAGWFGIVTFFIGGSVVFSAGLRAAMPAPPPPGTALCGTEVIGGLMLMVIGTPIGAVASAPAGTAIG